MNCTLFIRTSLFALFLTHTVAQAQSQQIIKYPKEIFTVLNNPGIGFTTFQRFNGDELNRGNHWTEGRPIEYQPFDGDLTNKNYPQSSIAYFRVYWKYVEPEAGKYNWQMIDKALRTAAERGQTLMLRIGPYGAESEDNDVPAWYRKMLGKEKPQNTAFRCDPEDPRYVQYFGGMIAALGQRYDGHPDLESVDMSIVGPWGEGYGTELLSEKTRAALFNSYTDNFKKTPLHWLPSETSHVVFNRTTTTFTNLAKGSNIAASFPDGSNNGEGPQMRYVGYRLDCLGDYYMDSRGKNNWGEDHWDTTHRWSHMLDYYPELIIKSGLADAWKKAPVAFEICTTFLKMLHDLKFDDEHISLIFNEALKLHVSSFNAKSSPVPDVWSPLVDKWLIKMGYRFVIRRFEYPSHVYRQGQLSFNSLWENVGVAPIYKDYQLAVRLRNAEKTLILPVSADIREWLPGAIWCEEKLYIPYDMPLGKYQLEVAIVAPASFEPRVKLAIEGVTDDGWYAMGDINVVEMRLE